MAPIGCQPSPCRTCAAARRENACRPRLPCSFLLTEAFTEDIGVPVEPSIEASNRLGPELLAGRPPRASVLVHRQITSLLDKN